MNLYKTSTAKPYSFLVIDTTLAWDNPLLFRKNLLARIQKLIMAVDDKIRDEKYNMELTEKQQKYHYQVKLINMNILQVKRCYLLIRVEW